MGIISWGHQKGNGVPLFSKTEWGNAEKRTPSINNFRCRLSFRQKPNTWCR